MSSSVPSPPPVAETARRGSPLRIEGLGLQIGGATILKDVELDIAAGSLVGVIGPNGAGKTTLFNVISGLMKPTSDPAATSSSTSLRIVAPPICRPRPSIRSGDPRRAASAAGADGTVVLMGLSLIHI